MLAGLEELELRTAHVNGVDIAYRATSDSLPPLLLLHGHPQTHIIWRKIFPALSARFALVLPDLRGYGDSGKPAAASDHSAHSKRAMAADMVALMRELGHARFALLAHDRGARVAHRLAMDYADAVDRLVLLDIAPTLAMYEGTTRVFAQKYWHWFFLIQPAPLPETLIRASPETYFHACMRVPKDNRAEVFGAAWDEYLRCARVEGWAEGMCEDYRASATIDLEHDQLDRDAGNKLKCPVLVLWGAGGVVDKCFDPLAEWNKVALDVRGESVQCGHYIPEEAPDELLEKALPFLLA